MHRSRHTAAKKDKRGEDRSSARLFHVLADRKFSSTPDGTFRSLLLNYRVLLFIAPKSWTGSVRSHSCYFLSALEVKR